MYCTTALYQEFHQKKHYIKNCLSYLRTPSTHSSMKVKDRVWHPSPHISNLSVEVRAFLQNAAGAFSLPPIKYTIYSKVCNQNPLTNKHQQAEMKSTDSHLSKFQKDHICYGTFQCGTQFQNLLCNACTTPLLQASPNHKHLEAKPMPKKKRKKKKYLIPKNWTSNGEQQVVPNH